MSAAVQRGQFAIEGVAGTFDVIAGPGGGTSAIQQTLKVAQNFGEEVVLDPHGYDTAWLARNEHGMLDVTFKLVGFVSGGTNSSAQAIAPIASGSLSSLGQPFLSPLTIVTLSNFPTSSLSGTWSLNGAWQCVTGADLDMGASKVGEFTVKLRHYASAAQNTAMAVVPT